ncbi:uncharacterized protein LOC131945983 [Physella acuta]|uniref:uncharacterized protein LOC131945983 n=1 Tax=Physella acuta TaxID=109671 RepID=UPI0027DDD614|nr:uncharacterized protein LOC131945983 [Physella acuta]
MSTTLVTRRELMEKMFKFALLICLGFLPDVVSSTGSLDLSIVGYEKKWTNDANCKNTGFVMGTFADRAAHEEGRCTHDTLFQSNSSADCSQSSSWQETCQLFGYPCQMSACGNSTRTQGKCSCSTGNPIMILSTTSPTLERHFNAELMEQSPQMGQVDTLLSVENSGTFEDRAARKESSCIQVTPFVYLSAAIIYLYGKSPLMMSLVLFQQFLVNADARFSLTDLTVEEKLKIITGRWDTCLKDRETCWKESENKSKEVKSKELEIADFKEKIAYYQLSIIVFFIGGSVIIFTLRRSLTIARQEEKSASEQASSNLIALNVWKDRYNALVIMKNRLLLEVDRVLEAPLDGDHGDDPAGDVVAGVPEPANGERLQVPQIQGADWAQVVGQETRGHAQLEARDQEVGQGEAEHAHGHAVVEAEPEEDPDVDDVADQPEAGNDQVDGDGQRELPALQLVKVNRFGFARHLGRYSAAVVRRGRADYPSVRIKSSSERAPSVSGGFTGN